MSVRTMVGFFPRLPKFEGAQGQAGATLGIEGKVEGKLRPRRRKKVGPKTTQRTSSKPKSTRPSTVSIPRRLAEQLKRDAFEPKRPPTLCRPPAEKPSPTTVSIPKRLAESLAPANKPITERVRDWLEQNVRNVQNNPFLAGVK